MLRVLARYVSAFDSCGLPPSMVQAVTLSYLDFLDGTLLHMYEYEALMGNRPAYMCSFRHVRRKEMTASPGLFLHGHLTELSTAAISDTKITIYRMQCENATNQVIRALDERVVQNAARFQCGHCSAWRINEDVTRCGNDGCDDWYCIDNCYNGQICETEGCDQNVCDDCYENGSQCMRCGTRLCFTYCIEEGDTNECIYNRRGGGAGGCFNLWCRIDCHEVVVRCVGQRPDYRRDLIHEQWETDQNIGFCPPCAEQHEVDECNNPNCVEHLCNLCRQYLTIRCDRCWRRYCVECPHEGVTIAGIEAQQEDQDGNQFQWTCQRCNNGETSEEEREAEREARVEQRRDFERRMALAARGGGPPGGGHGWQREQIERDEEEDLDADRDFYYDD